jgi:hypothetical protein
MQAGGERFGKIKQTTMLVSPTSQRETGRRHQLANPNWPTWLLRQFDFPIPEGRPIAAVFPTDVKAIGQDPTAAAASSMAELNCSAQFFSGPLPTRRQQFRDASLLSTTPPQLQIANPNSTVDFGFQKKNNDINEIISRIKFCRFCA